MATKATKSTSTEKAHVTRISATDTKPAKKTVVKKQSDALKPKKSKKRFFKPFIAFAGYFVGAWQELRQVRWPNRKATWSLTLAVLAFTAFFTVLILLLDALYKFLFELILK